MTTTSTTTGDRQPPELDTGVPQTARIWNYWLGGKDHYAADRQVGDQVREGYPQIVTNARACRAFLVRVVHYLAGEAGIRQFLDIGTGLPTADNTHEVAQRVVPQCRIVYVDNDPLVLVHARALLTSSTEGVTDYVDADLRDPDAVQREAARTLDFTQPIALLLMGVLGHISDDTQALSIVQKLTGSLPSGSFLAIYDGTDTSPEVREAVRIWNQSANPTYHLRSPGQIRRFFDGLDLIEPGVVSVPRWRPDLASSGTSVDIDQYGGVGYTSSRRAGTGPA